LLQLVSTIMLVPRIELGAISYGIYIYMQSPLGSARINHQKLFDVPDKTRWVDHFIFDPGAANGRAFRFEIRTDSFAASMTCWQRFAELCC
jgi:hypothetical protein